MCSMVELFPLKDRLVRDEYEWGRGAEKLLQSFPTLQMAVHKSDDYPPTHVQKKWFNSSLLTHYPYIANLRFIFVCKPYHLLLPTEDVVLKIYWNSLQMSNCFGMFRHCQKKKYNQLQMLGLSTNYCSTSNSDIIWY